MTPAGSAGLTALPPETLASLSFLAGHWRSERDNHVIEEVWLAPRAGVAQGSVLFTEGDAVRTIELIIVSAEPGRVVMRYNHFHPDYRTWESDGPITLTLTSAREGEVIFSNLPPAPRHALEMGYRLTGATTLTSWVLAMNADGAVSRFSFDFQRVA